MFWKVNCHCGSVNDPSEDRLHGTPRHVTLLELFEADWFSAKFVIIEIIWAENLVHRTEEDISDAVAIVSAL